MTALPPPPPPYAPKPPPTPQVSIKPAKGTSPLVIAAIVVGVLVVGCCGCGGMVTMLGMMSANQQLDSNFEAIQQQLEEEQRQQQEPPEGDWEE